MVQIPWVLRTVLVFGVWRLTASLHRADAARLRSRAAGSRPRAAPSAGSSPGSDDAIADAEAALPPEADSYPCCPVCLERLPRSACTSRRPRTEHGAGQSSAPSSLRESASAPSGLVPPFLSEDAGEQQAVAGVPSSDSSDLRTALGYYPPNGVVVSASATPSAPARLFTNFVYSTKNAAHSLLHNARATASSFCDAGFHDAIASMRIHVCDFQVRLLREPLPPDLFEWARDASREHLEPDASHGPLIFSCVSHDPEDTFQILEQDGILRPGGIVRNTFLGTSAVSGGGRTRSCATTSASTCSKMSVGEGRASTGSNGAAEGTACSPPPPWVRDWHRDDLFWYNGEEDSSHARPRRGQPKITTASQLEAAVNPNPIFLLFIDKDRPALRVLQEGTDYAAEWRGSCRRGHRVKKVSAALRERRLLRVRRRDSQTALSSLLNLSFSGPRAWSRQESRSSRASSIEGEGRGNAQLQEHQAPEARAGGSERSTRRAVETGHRISPRQIETRPGSRETRDRSRDEAAAPRDAGAGAGTPTSRSGGQTQQSSGPQPRHEHFRIVRTRRGGCDRAPGDGAATRATLGSDAPERAQDTSCFREGPPSRIEDADTAPGHSDSPCVTLPCGHAIHEHCLFPDALLHMREILNDLLAARLGVAGVCSPYRCPVCRYDKMVAVRPVYQMPIHVKHRQGDAVREWLAEMRRKFGKDVQEVSVIHGWRKAEIYGT